MSPPQHRRDTEDHAVAVNLTAATVAVDLSGEIVVGTDRSRAQFDGALAPYEAVVIR